MHQNNIDSIVTFLKRVNPFSQYDETVLHDIASTVSVVYIESDEILMQQGDPADSFYLVKHGRLRAFAYDPSVMQKVAIGEIGQGEIVGEIGLILEDVRTATIQALRDSELLKFSQKTFNELLQKYPELIMGLAKASIKRLTNKTLPKNTVVTIAVLPAGNNPLLTDFTQKLVAQLQKVGNTLYLNEDFFANQSFSYGNHLDIAWLNEQENIYDYIVYEANIRLNDWTRRCIRQADRILLVGHSDNSSTLNEIEIEFFQEKYVRHHLLTEFVLLYEEIKKEPSVMSQWLKNRPVNNYYNLRNFSQHDFEKLTRFLTGSAQGLVLCGGGARAMAHLGVLRAFQELKIKFDIIGGSSMGAWIGALFSKEMTYEEMMEKTAQYVQSYYKCRYTLPLVSLLNDKNLNYAMREGFGKNVMIEDLWHRFFCVSTNLSHEQLIVHDRGLLWRAIRASISLPGIFPPIFTKNDDILVDGGVMNNLPVDVMHNYINGGKIFAVSLVPGDKYIKYTPQSLSSGWKLFFKRYNPVQSEKSYPTIGRTIIKATTLSSKIHAVLMEKEVHYLLKLDMNQFGLLDFKFFREIAEKGYRDAMDMLQEDKYKALLKISS